MQSVDCRNLPIRQMALIVLMAAFAAASFTARRAAAEDAIVVQSTTSTQNSGFYRHVVPAFTAETGVAVRVIAVGTGQALKNARNCRKLCARMRAFAAEK